jgi:hypothetical protein
MAAGVDAFLETGETHPDPLGGLWLRALAYVAVDLVMDLEGKRRRAALVALAPITGVGTGSPQPLPLPGGRLFGFAGFASPRPGRFEVQVARHCAREYLEACDLIPAGEPPPASPQWTPEDDEAFTRDLRRGLEMLGDRLGAVVRQSHLVNLLPGLDGAVLGMLAGRAERLAAKLSEVAAREDLPAPLAFELRVKVPSRRFELDGKGLGDRDLKPIRLAPGGPWTLVTSVEWEPESGPWSGDHVTPEGTLAIHRDGVGPLPDSVFCHLALPSGPTAVQGGLWPHPVFEAEIGDEDEGQELAAERWGKALPGVVALDKTLLEP